MKIALALLALFSFGSQAGGGSSPGVAKPSHREPKSGARVYAPMNGWNIRSAKDLPSGTGSVTTSNGVIIWNLQGAILDGKNQSGKLDDNENNEPLFRARVPLIVRNGFARNVKNAMGFLAKNSGVENMTFLSCGEDCVSTSKGAYGIRIVDSEFLGRSGGDKLVQLNEAKDALVSGNMFYSNVTALRIGDSDTTSVSDQSTVKNNRFVGNDTAIHASKITVNESGNKFDGVKTPWKSANGAVKK